MNASTPTTLAHTRPVARLLPFASLMPVAEWRKGIWKIVIMPFRGRLFSESIAPLLAHVLQIVQDIFGDDAVDLDLIQRFRSRDLRAKGLLEGFRFDLRGFGAEQELHEQSGCIGMLGARHDAGGPNHRDSAVGRVEDGERVTLGGTAQCGCWISGRQYSLARIQDCDSVINGAGYQRFAVAETGKIFPAVHLLERHRPRADHAAEIWIAERNLVRPFRIQQLLPSLWDVSFANFLIIVGDRDEAHCRNVIKTGGVKVLEGRNDLLFVLRTVGFQRVVTCELNELARIGRTEYVRLRCASAHVLE